MNARLTLLFIPATFLALAATGFVMKSGPAIAQQASEETEEIVVQAPISTRQVGRAQSGAAIELTEVKHSVNYADLDLSKHADVIELETRVETVSKEVCEELSDMFPFDSTDATKRDCLKEAIDSAEQQLQAAIAAAN